MLISPDTTVSQQISQVLIHSIGSKWKSGAAVCKKAAVFTHWALAHILPVVQKNETIAGHSQAWETNQGFHSKRKHWTIHMGGLLSVFTIFHNFSTLSTLLPSPRVTIRSLIQQRHTLGSVRSLYETWSFPLHVNVASYNPVNNNLILLLFQLNVQKGIWTGWQWLILLFKNWEENKSKQTKNSSQAFTAVAKYCWSGILCTTWNGINAHLKLVGSRTRVQKEDHIQYI